MNQELNELPRGNWHETLASLLGSIAEKFIAAGRTVQQANDDAVLAVQGVTDVYQGCLLYIPIEKNTRAQMRNHQMYAEFDGTNTKELARKYECSMAHVYRVIKRHRALQLARKGNRND